MKTPIDDGGMAFPMGNPTDGGEIGMTLRDYFAGQVLIGLSVQRMGITNEHDAQNAYSMADAMIKARSTS